MAENPTDIIKRYLEDAIAAEKNFETQLQGNGQGGGRSGSGASLRSARGRTRVQYERLTARLEALGGSPSTMKSFLAHFFGLSPKAARAGHEREEKTTQDLMMAYAVENSEVAMYESLITICQAAGDHETAALTSSCSP